MLWFAVALLLALSTPGAHSAVVGTNAPVVGVLAVPLLGGPCSTAVGAQANATSCFEVYYVQWLEQAGIQVAIIPYDGSAEVLDALFDGINGLLFTGGDLTLEFNTTYYQTAHYLFEKVLAANAAGDYFPLWGTCMGFQLLNILAAGNWSVLDRGAFNSENMSVPLDFQPNWGQSRMFGDAPNDIIDIFLHRNVTLNLHHDGITPETFSSNAAISGLYQMISTNTDRDGKAFVSTLEGWNVPIYGTQWHPERNQYEWRPNLDIHHSMDAVRAAQYVANFIGYEVRKSQHKFPSTKAKAASLIYNYPLLPDPERDSHQSYYFNT